MLLSNEILGQLLYVVAGAVLTFLYQRFSGVKPPVAPPTVPPSNPTIPTPLLDPLLANHPLANAMLKLLTDALSKHAQTLEEKSAETKIGFRKE